MSYTVKDYKKELDTQATFKLRALIANLPKFCKPFFTSVDSSAAKKTQISYAKDLGVFFKWIIQSNPSYKDELIRNIPIEAVTSLNSQDIDEYMEWLNSYKVDDKTYSNEGKSKKRKLCTLRTFYKYLVRVEKIEKNPATLVNTPKLQKDEIPVFLTPEEVKAFLSVIENGTGLSEKQLCYHKKTKVRDYTIFCLLLNTGIRVSELVGLNLTDFDYKNHSFMVIRKGNKGDTVYYNNEVADALSYYIDYDRISYTEDDEEQALFLSLQGRRITDRAVEKLCEKYVELASEIPDTKHITPHKLRSTYGTAVYRQTSDIYMTAEALGHKDVNTTTKYYAKVDEAAQKAVSESFKYKTD